MTTADHNDAMAPTGSSHHSVPTRPQRKRGVFAYSTCDASPVVAALLHMAYVVTVFAIFRRTPWWLLIPMGFVYALSISWNINGISHKTSKTEKPSG